MSIKEIIKEAGRLDEVVIILAKIISEVDEYPPVRCHVDQDNKTSFRVNGEVVRMQASELLCVILNDLEWNGDPMCTLEVYVGSELERKLHNCGNDLSHRKPPSEESLENLRVWQIIYNLIICKFLGSSEGYKDEHEDWDIPEGWKKK